MLSFRSDDERPARDDKPHICADGQKILFRGPESYRVGYAEEGYVFDVAEGVLAYMRRHGLAAEKIAKRVETPIERNARLYVERATLGAKRRQDNS